MEVNKSVVDQYRRENKRDFDTYKLGPKILAVALEGSGKEWVAYIGTIVNSSDEWPVIALGGTKLSKRIASALFPRFDKKYTWRS